MTEHLNLSNPLGRQVKTNVGGTSEGTALFLPFMAGLPLCKATIPRLLTSLVCVCIGMFNTYGWVKCCQISPLGLIMCFFIRSYVYTHNRCLHLSILPNKQLCLRSTHSMVFQFQEVFNIDFRKCLKMHR